MDILIFCFWFNQLAKEKNVNFCENYYMTLRKQDVVCQAFDYKSHIYNMFVTNTCCTQVLKEGRQKKISQTCAIGTERRGNCALLLKNLLPLSTPGWLARSYNSIDKKKIMAKKNSKECA